MKRIRLLVALLLSSLTSFAEEATRCGHFQGKVIKIEQSYIYGWPQYKGTSVWNADKFKKGLQMGCDDPMDHLAVIVHWPEMTPNGGLDYQPSIHNIVIVLFATIGDGSMIPFIDGVLEDAKLNSNEEIKEQVKLDPETGLWKLEVKDSTNGRILGTHYDADWGYEKDSKVITRRIRCAYFNNISLNNCELNIFLNDYKAFLSVKFTRNLLPQWPELERQALAFIRSKTIH